MYEFLDGLNRELDDVRGRVLSYPLPTTREVFTEVRREKNHRNVSMKMEMNGPIDDVEMSTLLSSSFWSTGNEFGPPQFRPNSSFMARIGSRKLGLIFLILGLLLDLLILEIMSFQNSGLLELGLEWRLYQKKLQMGQARSKRGDYGATTIENLDTKKILVGIYMGSPEIGIRNNILKIMLVKSWLIKRNLQTRKRWSIQ